MKSTALAIALLLSGAAVAQTTVDPNLDVDADVSVQPDGDLDIDADVDTNVDTTTAHSTAVHSGPTMTMAPASGALVQPSNASPERDARGIAVISDAAMVPAGWNGLMSGSTGRGGPLLDPATGATIDTADSSYRACTKQITDNCVQTYERRRAR